MNFFGKISRSLVVGIVAFVLFFTIASAQERGMGNPNGREKLKQALNLSNDQMAKIKDVKNKTRMQAEKDREQFKNAQDKLKEARLVRQKAEDQEITKILTPEQKAKFDKMMEERRSERPKMNK